MVLKRSKYEDVGAPSYWVVDPDAPSFVAYDFVDGAYVEVTRADGDEGADVISPFAVHVVPSGLI
jgi:Uma2 family endonuclease